MTQWAALPWHAAGGCRSTLSALRSCLRWRCASTWMPSASTAGPPPRCSSGAAQRMRMLCMVCALFAQSNTLWCLVPANIISRLVHRTCSLSVSILEMLPLPPCSLATFGLFVLLGKALTAPLVFTSLALFNVLIAPLNAFPWVVNGWVAGVG